MVDFEFKIIDVEKGTHLLNSDNGGEWNVEDLPDAPDYVLHEHDFYTEEQVREILIKFANSKNAMRRDMTVEQIVDDWLLEASIG
ncbi:hypothetical protein [Weissella confusa]|uniref:hypothetical protein n=1 Tax=Weissella confusa TaxID=1583 RepID=UPI00223BD3BC|nr:hypothetical protein [Weissella confusa]MCS9991229.1 hypothetical protein [Weissella confusa]